MTTRGRVSLYIGAPVITAKHGGFESPMKADLGGKKGPLETPLSRAKPQRNPRETPAKARLKARFSGLKPE